MIKFLGQCVQNFIQATKYTLKGNVRFSSIISQMSAIGFDSLGICLSIVFIASRAAAMPSVGTAVYSASKGAIIS